MKCTKCERKAVYNQTNQSLCKDHFLDYFENKVFKTMKKYKLFNQEDNICVATSGGKDSISVLFMTMKYCNEHKIKFFALAIDEGIQGYRDHTLDDLKKFCKNYKIKLHVVSFKKEFGFTLDQMRDKAMKDFGKKPCTICGVFRRTLLNRTARELKATKLVTGHNMDDEAQSFMMNLFKGNMSHNAPLGPISGLSDNKKFITRVKPLYHIMEKETRLYALLKGFKVSFNECPNIDLSFRAAIRDRLNEIESQFPGSKNGVINSFLEILPTLKEKYKNEKPFSYCEKCGDACSGKKCNSCLLEEQLCQEAK
jgi:tRNA-5-methyluridine54 2-sulfurtransferase